MNSQHKIVSKYIQILSLLIKPSNSEVSFARKRGNERNCFSTVKQNASFIGHFSFGRQ